MAQALLGAITKKGPLTQSQIHGLFLRNRNAAEIDGVLARLQSAKKIACTTEPSGLSGGRPKRVWHVYGKSNEKTQAPGKRRIFCCLRFPSLVIGNRVKFEAGFFVTDDPQKIQLIEKSGEFGLVIQDVSEILKEIPLTAGKRIYLSSDPCLALSDHAQYHVRFLQVADGLGIFSRDIPDCHRMIEQSGLLKTGAVRQVPESLLAAAALRGRAGEPQPE